MKKINSILIIIMLSLLIVSCDNKEKKKNIDNNVNNNVKDDNKITYDYYFLSLTVNTDPENPNKLGTYIYKLYLLSNKTYWFVSGVDCIDYQTGTYESNQDGYILHEGKTFGCNKCYYESNEGTYNLIIKDNTARLIDDYTDITLLKTKNDEELKDFMVNYDKKCGEN